MKFLLLLICVASVSCVQVEFLCPSNRFDYNGLTVNAFHKVQHKTTFQSLRHYLIDHRITCDQSEFDDQSNYWKALRLRNGFNRKFAELYTEELNGASAKELRSRELQISNAWVSLFELSRTENKSECLNIFEQKAWKGLRLFSNLLAPTEKNAFPIYEDVEFEPTNLEAIKILEHLFEQLNTDADGQTFALKGESAFDFYFDHGFVLAKEFKFLADGPVHPDAKTVLTLEMYLPFHTDQPDDQPDDTNCVPVDQLPLFYKNNGKK